MCAQISGEQCLSIYFGEWPWREVHLVCSTPEPVKVWLSGLQDITHCLKRNPDIAGSIILRNRGMLLAGAQPTKDTFHWMILLHYATTLVLEYKSCMYI